MLELISIVAALALCILIPIEVRRIRGGWVHKKFAGDRAKHIAAYRKQLTVMIFMGAIFAVFGIVFAATATRPGEATIKIVAAVIWLVVSCICFVSRRMLPTELATDPMRGAGQ